ncbi:MAG: hypothetical protein JSV77_06305 [Dehalococcoidales bacterium]|nr:MAG: hypothetical protein JSV77_06305 [Dehalococcoidales bacterium]
MDTGAIWVVVSLLIVVALFSFLRGRGSVRRHPEIIQLILTDVKMDQALVSAFYLREKPRKFERNNWELYKNDVGFLGESLNETLRLTFSIVEDLNQEIKLVKKSKTSHQSINVAKLTEPLAACRKGLEDWMMEHLGTTEPPLKRPSFLGTFFGQE